MMWRNILPSSLQLPPHSMPHPPDQVPFRPEHHAPCNTQSAILSAVIFNALIIILLIPWQLKE